MKRFHYAHQVALDRAIEREREAARAFVRAREACAVAARACDERVRCMSAIRADASATLRARAGTAPAVAPIAALLIASENALTVLASRQADAAAELRGLEDRTAVVRDEFTKRLHDRDALERHRANRLADDALVRERSEEAACDEMSALAREARVRTAGMNHA